MNKKLLNLVKKNNVQKDVYCSEVNSKINKKYKYGEEHAIIRKTLNNVITELEKLGVDPALFQEFKTYYDFVENNKKETKQVLEVK